MAVAIFAVVDQIKTFGRLDGISLLPHDKGVAGQPAPLLRRCESKPAKALVIGRIHKHEVKRRSGPARKVPRIASDDLGLRLHPEFRDILTDETLSCTTVVHKSDMRRSTRQGLEPQRPGACKKIEDPCALENIVVV